MGKSASKFVEKSINKMRIEEFLENMIGSEGYSHSDIQTTPIGTRITIHTSKPGLIIGRGGEKINQITEKLKEFGLNNPQIDIEEIDNPNLDAQIVAEEIRRAIENGVSFKKIGNIMISKIIESGAVGAEINISGKLQGSRGRTEKFLKGYMKQAGEVSERLVDKGKAIAKTKPGTIGVRVKIMAELPEEVKGKLGEIEVEKEEGGEDEKTGNKKNE